MRRAKHVVTYNELYDYFLEEDIFRFVRYEETRICNQSFCLIPS